MIVVTLLIIILSLLVYYFVQYVNARYKYWEIRGVVHEKPAFLFGSMKDFILGKKSDYGIYEEIYRKYPNEPFVGIYSILTPVLLVRDLDIAKRIMAEDFEDFHTRGIKFYPEDTLANNVLFLSGEKWKLIRQKLTPSFTSGRLKKMTPLIARCCEQLQSYVSQKIENEQPMNVRNIAADFTSSVISSCAFGVESNTLSECETPFRDMGRNFFEQNFVIKISIILEDLIPNILQRFQISRFRGVDRLFIGIFKKVLREREESKIPRNDFIDVCLELKQEKFLKDPRSVGEYTLEVTDELLAAQAFFFFLAGHETSETSLSFALYELTHNKECLSRVHDEIDRLSTKYNNVLTYEAIDEAVYLDKVIKEALRKYPPIGNLQRECTKDYMLPGGVKLEKGVRTSVPAFAIQNDEQYYPNPNEFNPDRFDDPSVEHSYAYMPFGKGPRHCLGQRLAMIQVKAGLFALLKAFTLESDKTYEPKLQLKAIFLGLKPISIEEINIVPRKKNQ